MASRALESEIDRLYQLPPDEFTAARNALAKGAGGDAARLRALAKPPIAAWAVNQLYWRDRDTWDALIEAAQNARRTHKAVLSGRAGDVRAAGQVHDEAVDAAVKSTLALLAASGHPVTDATRQAIGTTVRALPGEEAPGRLTRVLQPGGFEMLAGLSMASLPAAKTTRPPKAEAAPAPAKTGAARTTTAVRPKVDAKALTRARQAAAAATRALREAETAARREEFEQARTEREEKRAGEAVEKARDAVKHAEADLEQAEAAAVTARRNREAAAKRAREAEKALAAAREGAAAAADSVKRVEKGESR